MGLFVRLLPGCPFLYDDDDVDASRCVPPAGTKVALCKLAAHTVMNEQCGTIVGYSAEADRYVVQLEDGTRVRVCRGNLRLEALTTHDFAHAISETCTAFSRLAARHGASMTSELVGALLAAAAKPRVDSHERPGCGGLRVGCAHARG